MAGRVFCAALATAVTLAGGAAASELEPLYAYDKDAQSRWYSPENPTGAPGQGGRENKGAKGRAWQTIAAGGTQVLADAKGAGIVDRFWITIDDRSPERLRELRLEIYWDGAKTPAVSVPFGDFFLHGAGETTRMDTALFASPEARSFVSYVPMPYRKAMRMQVVNESAKPLNLIFWDVNLRELKRAPQDALYFHAFWSREQATEVGRDFRVLPRVVGKGRFLGMSVTVLTDPRLGKSWWGEGEVKVWLDGDRDLPTLVGTGAEDYIGTAWGQGAYASRWQGAPVADEATGRWTFYRFHGPDPIWFHEDVEVRFQQIGGWPKPEVLRLQREGAPLKPVTLDGGSRDKFVQLLESDPPRPLTDPTLAPEGWANFYRSDDVAAVAYFYLDRPENGLPAIPPAAERVRGIRLPVPPAEKK